MISNDYITYNDGSVTRYYLTIDGIITNQFVDMAENSASQSCLTQNYNATDDITVLPILLEYDLTNTDTEEKHLVYVIEGGVAIPVLITYVTVTNEVGATYSEAICQNLNNGTYIDYGTINRIKEASDALLY